MFKNTCYFGKFQNYATFVLLYYLFTLIPTDSLRCYQCGEYTDGVGSITPCINYTDEKHLRECSNENAQCIKYVMDASTVRGCSTNCVEKAERWGTKTYCCNEHACNSSTTKWPSSILINLFICISIILIIDFTQLINVKCHRLLK